MSTTTAGEPKPIFRKVTVASDHAAFDLKKQVIDYIKEKYGSSVEIYDAGVYSADRMDYPDITRVLCTSIQKSQFDAGILMCGTGIGTSIAANKYHGIRCGLCHDHYTAKMCRQHNDANVLSLGSRTTGIEVAKEMIDAFLTTKFLGDRHQQRIEKISLIEKEQQSQKKEMH